MFNRKFNLKKVYTIKTNIFKPLVGLRFHMVAVRAVWLSNGGKERNAAFML